MSYNSYSSECKLIVTAFIKLQLPTINGFVLFNQARWTIKFAKR